MEKESIYDKYEAVIGLEIHAQLMTESKMYCGDSTAFGLTPNTNVSPISLGHPGTLPTFNTKAMEFGVKMGLACGCAITHENQFARKNYFYADLPKGYQITQDTTPICTGGHIIIKDDLGNPKKIGLTRIHMEEDSGKSNHDMDPFKTLIDLNRAGVPLLEIVSEPDLRTPQEAYNYLTEVRQLVRYLEICDGNMEEGSMRCDANVSVRLKGSKEFGQRTETKNLNSIRNVFRAINYEIKRQIEAIENGEEVTQQTMNFDAVSGKTSVMRSKEMAHDYRYFPEPDLQAVYVEQGYIDDIKSMLPKLPAELIEKYTKQLKLSDYDAEVLTEDKAIALYYEEVIKHTENYKSAANWLMGSIKSYLNENALTILEFPVAPAQIAGLIALIDSGKINNTIAAQKVFPEMVKKPQFSAEEIAKSNNWIQNSDSSSLEGYIKEAIEKYPEKATAYKAGNKNLLGLFMGEVMKISKGKADPKITNQLLREALEK
jgi:aspartyl-tRNA(Asn)/glutamyl-tRNA(Gln) amidotransferase subunit B